MSWSGCSATSGSRLFMSMRMAASCGQSRHDKAVPRGARTGRGPAGTWPVVPVIRANLLGHAVEQAEDQAKLDLSERADVFAEYGLGRRGQEVRHREADN